MKINIVAVVVTGLLAGSTAHAAEVYNKDGNKLDFMEKLPLSVILLMINVMMVIKRMPASALKVKPRSTTR